MKGSPLRCVEVHVGILYLAIVRLTMIIRKHINYDRTADWGRYCPAPHKPTLRSEPLCADLRTAKERKPKAYQGMTKGEKDADKGEKK